MSEVIHASQKYVKKIARTIAAEEVAKIVANAPDDLDTLKEIADYIASDKTGAAQLSTAIANAQQTANEAKSGLDGKADKSELEAVDETASSAYALAEATNEDLGSVGSAVDEANRKGDDNTVSISLINEILGEEELDKPNILRKYPFEVGSVGIDSDIKEYTLDINAFANTQCDDYPPDQKVIVRVKADVTGKMRDAVLVITCNDTPMNINWDPAVTWFPRTDLETDMGCDPNAENVYFITEFAPNEFLVSRWVKEASE